MKTNQLLILGAVGVAAYLLVSKTQAGQQMLRPIGVGLPTSQFAPGTPGWAANQQALADQQQYRLLNQTGSLLGGLFNAFKGGPVTGPSFSPVAGGATPIGSGGGQWRPSTYDGAYDYSATNTPYQAQTEAQVLYGDTGYGDWGPTDAQTIYGDAGYGDWN